MWRLGEFAVDLGRLTSLTLSQIVVIILSYFSDHNCGSTTTDMDF